jgi:GH15 family glucan-1,4-alpha-glucosidase
MGVYLPTGAVGNGETVGTIGASGEIMGLFWPRLDHAQNVREAMPAVYLGHPQQGRFLWTWEAARRKQYYVGATNILATQLFFDDAGLEILITDACPPGESALVRRVRVENRSGQDIVGSFMHYFELWLGEAEWKQAVRYESDHECALQYYRNYAAAVGGTRPDEWRCGKWTRTDEGSAKVDMLDGHLNGQPEDIGQVNFALGWHLQLPAEGSRDITIIVAIDESRELAVARLERLRPLGAKELHRLAHEDDNAWLKRAKPVKAGAVAAEPADAGGSSHAGGHRGAGVRPGLRDVRRVWVLLATRCRRGRGRARGCGLRRVYARVGAMACRCATAEGRVGTEVLVRRRGGVVVGAAR